MTVAPVLAANHANALCCLRGTLHLGDGVSHYDRGDWGGAIAGYTRALAEYLRLKLDSRAMTRCDESTISHQRKETTSLLRSRAGSCRWRFESRLIWATPREI